MKKEGYIVIEYRDYETNTDVQEHNWISEKGYCYRQTALSDGTTFPARRISLKQYENALDEYYNA